MKTNKLTRKLPYLIIFSVFLFLLTGCNNISKPESSSKPNEVGINKESEVINNPVFRALATNIDE